jgi:hypothetical protein
VTYFTVCGTPTDVSFGPSRPRWSSAFESVIESKAATPAGERRGSSRPGTNILAVNLLFGSAPSVMVFQASCHVIANLIFFFSLFETHLR